MKSKRSIPLTDKLPLYFILLGIIVLAASGILAFYSTREALLDRTFDQLISVRTEKQKRVEKFFGDARAKADRLTRSAQFQNKEITGMNEISDEDQLFSHIFLLHPESQTIYFQSAPLEISKGELSTLLKKISDTLTIPSHRPYFLDINLPGFKHLVLVQKVPARPLALFIINQKGINSIMLENNPHNGLGESGEAYLVGQDRFMRSQSRFIANSVYAIEVNSTSVERAMKGETGIEIIHDYRDIPVLSSFSLFTINGLQMAVLAEIDLEEAMVPVYKIRNRIFLISIIISMIVFLFSFFGVRRIIKPIIVLKDAAFRIGKGEFDLRLPVNNNDEIGDLTQSFNQMTARLEEQTQELKTQKQKQLRSMIDGQEYERQRFSRELHDGLGQSLSAIKMQLEGSIGLETNERNKKTRDLLASIDVTIDEVRRMSNNLQPVLLDNFGISTALQNLCNEIAPTAPFNLMSEIEEIDVKLSKRIQTYLFRIAQEGLNNIVKHASAGEVGLNFFVQDGTLVLSIEDDGKGFDIKVIGKTKGQGLDNMIQRASLINGKIDLNSVPGKGTIITVSLPVNCKK
ncbi:MAG: sensor histidine kinase [Bacteroidales bacterium]|nr:sensor histidine kinase [Bacteroidales bacterium]MCF8458958.1 sensor histidine kinase [Bacteroidales bacterium]